MEESLFSDIMFYTYLMDLIANSTVRIYSFSCRKDVEGLLKESQNRERLLKILVYVQNKIENRISTLSNVDEDTKQILKIWSDEVTTWYAKTNKIDQATAQFLEEHKDSITREIATVFRQKESIRGYNLNSVKK